jgi:hypothetical protein
MKLQLHIPRQQGTGAIARLRSASGGYMQANFKMAGLGRYVVFCFNKYILLIYSITWF